MKLTGAEAARYLAAPDPGRAGLLIYGADAMRVALKRQDAIAALVGPQGEAEMRLTRLPAGDLRRDPARIADAIKETGFFPGPRVVFAEDATDTVADPILRALSDWQPGDAVIVVTAGTLAAKSALRKAFEADPRCVAIGIYDDPPGREEIAQILKTAGLRDVTPEALADLTQLARALDPGDFRQTCDRIGLYKWGDATPLSSDEVAALAPATIEAEIDDLIHAVAEGRTQAMGVLMTRLAGQGTNPVTLSITTLRHFRALHAAAADPQGPGAGLSRLRPPVFGPRRDRMERQARDWSTFRLEEAIRLLIDTDLTLRSTSRAPAAAVMERALIRLSMMPRR